MSTVSLDHKAERLSIGIKNFGTDVMRIKANRHHFMVESSTIANNIKSIAISCNDQEKATCSYEELQRKGREMRKKTKSYFYKWWVGIQAGNSQPWHAFVLFLPTLTRMPCTGNFIKRINAHDMDHIQGCIQKFCKFDCSPCCLSFQLKCLRRKMTSLVKHKEKVYNWRSLQLNQSPKSQL